MRNRLSQDLLDRYPNLRRSTASGVGRPPDSYWSLESLRDGLRYFFDLHGRYPKATEVDNFDFLPSARSIQRSFGGLQSLRKKFGHEDIHFGKGKFRSEISRLVNPRGRRRELKIEQLLRNKFGEVFVHTEKFFNSTKCRVDFYVYSPGGNFGVDVFDTDTRHNFMTNINSKKRKYGNFTDELYFLVMNESFQQRDLDSYVQSMKRPLPLGAYIVNLETFLGLIEQKVSFPDPLASTKSKDEKRG